MENKTIKIDIKNNSVEKIAQIQNNPLIVSSHQNVEHSGKQLNHVLRGICAGIWYDEIWTGI